jgi:hypothetical protein
LTHAAGDGESLGRLFARLLLAAEAGGAATADPNEVLSAAFAELDDNGHQCQWTEEDHPEVFAAMHAMREAAFKFRAAIDDANK